MLSRHNGEGGQKNGDRTCTHRDTFPSTKHDDNKRYRPTSRKVVVGKNAWCVRVRGARMQ